MSDAFQDRGKGFERKFEVDQEQQFRAAARRDKIFGQWAAGKLGYAGAAAEKYAMEVVDSNFACPGDDDMLGKVMDDFKRGNVAVSDAELRQKLSECANEAAKQIAGPAK